MLLTHKNQPIKACLNWNSLFQAMKSELVFVFTLAVAGSLSFGGARAAVVGPFQQDQLYASIVHRFFKKKWAIPGLSLVYFHLFKQTLQFLQHTYVKNVYPVYGAGIRTHNLQGMSLLQQPLGQGSHPYFTSLKPR